MASPDLEIGAARPKGFGDRPPTGYKGGAPVGVETKSHNLNYNIKRNYAAEKIRSLGLHCSET